METIHLSLTSKTFRVIGQQSIARTTLKKNISIKRIHAPSNKPHKFSSNSVKKKHRRSNNKISNVLHDGSSTNESKFPSEKSDVSSTSADGKFSIEDPTSVIVGRVPTSDELYENVPDLKGKGVFPFSEFPEWDPTAKIPTSTIPGCEHLPFQTVPGMWGHLASKYAPLMAVTDAYHSPRRKFTFQELHTHLQTFARGLTALGLRQHEYVSIFGESSHRWLVCDQAVMMLGAVDCVRGSDHTPLSEHEFILKSSKSVAVFCETPELLATLLPKIRELNQGGTVVRFAVCMWGSWSASADSPCPVWNYDDVLEAGEKSAGDNEEKGREIKLTDVATLVYTSGTTGESPREGVCLTHANLLYEIGNLGTVVQGRAGSVGLALLPPWHIYERTSMYYRFSCGVHTVFSCVKHLRRDLRTHQPEYFCTVPLVLQTLASKALSRINTLTGFMGWLGRFLYKAGMQYILSRRIVNGVELDHAFTPFTQREKIWHFSVMTVLWGFYALADFLIFRKIRDVIAIRGCAVSGGGSLAKGLDDFYEVVGIQVLNGWGLTETSPVLSARKFPPDYGDFSVNVRGTIGTPLPATELMVVDPETYHPLSQGERGLIMCRGPQVMRSHLGYLGNTKANSAAFPIGNEWFDTGDLGYICPEIKGSKMAGQVVLTGRQKDTIVLSSGENIEPEPIELACLQSGFIKQIMVVGQDQKDLGALVVPDYEHIAEVEDVHKTGDWLQEGELEDVLFNEIKQYNWKPKKSFKEIERIMQIRIVEEPFTVQNGLLGNTLKMKRHEIMNKYGDVVGEMFE